MSPLEGDKSPKPSSVESSSDMKKTKESSSFESHNLRSYFDQFFHVPNWVTHYFPNSLQGRISQNQGVSLIDAQPKSSLSFPKLEDLKQSNYLSRIPQSDWEKIIDKIYLIGHTITNEELEVTNEELEVFKKGKWENPIFLDQDWIYVAFQAYFEEKLTVSELNKLILYDSCQYISKRDLKEEAEILANKNETTTWQSNFRLFYPYTSTQSPRLKTYQLYDSTGLLDTEARDQLRIATKYLSENQFSNLMDKISTLSPENSQFFLLRRDFDYPSEKNEDLRIRSPLLKRIISSDRKNVYPSFKFTIHQEKEQTWQMVAPPDFIYELMYSKCKENSIRGDPVIGYSPTEDMSDTTKRVMFIPCSLVLASTSYKERQKLFALEKEATDLKSTNTESVHEFEGTILDVYFHDIYHLYLESHNVHRPLWINWANYLVSKNYLKAADIAFDKEFRQYCNTSINQELNFWSALLGQHSLICETISADLGDKLAIMFAEFYLSDKNTTILDIDLLKKLIDRPYREPPHLETHEKKFLNDIYSNIYSS